MDDWIGVKERLPEDSQLVWLFRFHGKGPTMRATKACFRVLSRGPVFSLAGGKLLGENDWEIAGLTHWKPRYEDTPPSPHLTGTTDQRIATRTPIRMNLSDEERERRRQRMRDFWAKKRGQAAEMATDGM